MTRSATAKALEKARLGGGLGFEAATTLLKLGPDSPEAHYVLDVARDLGMRACDGSGYLFGQIGVDQTPCPENCLFCSFAAVNSNPEAIADGGFEVPLERIVHCAQLFADEGVALISLMATAGLDFDRYLAMVRAVRDAVPAEVTIMANAGDLAESQARALKVAGADAAYHAVRLGEGQITDVSPERRRQTITNLREAGIALMTGIEPVWEGVSAEAVAQRIGEIASFEPFCMGACALTSVEGIDVEGKRPASRDRVRYIAAIARLACGTRVPIGGIGATAWIDAGCDPRNRHYGDDDATLSAKAARARHDLAQRGFDLARILPA